VSQRGPTSREGRRSCRMSRNWSAEKGSGAARWSRKRVANRQRGEAGGRPFMRSKSLSRSRMSTPGWGSASHPSRFSLYPPGVETLWPGPGAEAR